jgi:hypothetical protein
MIKFIRNSFNGRKQQCNIPDFIQRSFLKKEMDKIEKSCKKRGEYCYEIYTLMCAIAVNNNIPYNLDIHHEIQNVV